MKQFAIKSTAVLIIYLLILTLGWGILAFYTWEIHPNLWSRVDRGCWLYGALSALIFTPLFYSLVDEHIK